MIFLAFDFGIKNIGVAVGQNITKSATMLNSIKCNNNIPNWEKINILLKIWKPYCVIIGLPLNMDGSEQILTKKVYEFSKKFFTLFNVKVYLHDERLSSLEAKSELFFLGGVKNLKKNYIDSFSAVLILESWFRTNIFNCIH